MKSLTREYTSIFWIDMAAIQKLTSSPISLDGIHLTADGHRLVANRLLELLNGERHDYTGWQHINQYESFYKYYERWYKRPSSRS